MYCRERFELEAEGTGESGVYPASSGRISSTAQRRNRIAKQIDRVPVSKSRPVGKGTAGRKIVQQVNIFFFKSSPSFRSVKQGL